MERVYPPTGVATSTLQDPMINGTDMFEVPFNEKVKQVFVDREVSKTPVRFSLMK